MSTRASLVYWPYFFGFHVYHDVADNEIHVEMEFMIRRVHVEVLRFVLRHEVADRLWPGVRFKE